MPPLNRELLGDDGPRLNEINYGNENPFPSPTGSCISLGALEDDSFKFAHPPILQAISRKSVSFAADDCLQNIQWIEPSGEWSDEERSSRWLSQDDYAAFRMEIFHTLYLLRNHPESIDDINHTARGIECRDPVIIQRRQRVKQQAWQAVFEEQKSLREDSLGNSSGQDNWMATQYSQAARPALREALNYASIDEMAAKTILQQDAKEQETDDDFSDDWIRSISSDKSASSGSEKDCEFCVFGPDSGFDDAWIRGD